MPTTSASKSEKENKKEKKKSKKNKDDTGLKRPLSAYMLYNNFRRPDLKEKDACKYLFSTSYRNSCIPAPCSIALAILLVVDFCVLFYTTFIGRPFFLYEFL